MVVWLEAGGRLVHHYFEEQLAFGIGFVQRRLNGSIFTEVSQAVYPVAACSGGGYFLLRILGVVGDVNGFKQGGA